MVENKTKLSPACQMVMNKYAPPASATVVASKPSMTTKPTAIRTAQTNARPGKPLSIRCADTFAACTRAGPQPA